MELSREQVAALHGRVDGHAVISGSRHDAVVGRPQIIGMDEIDVGMFLQPGEQAPSVRKVERIPADVRDLQARCFRDPPDAPPEHAEAGDARRFPAALEQHLQAEADAEERPAGTDEVKHWANEARALQRAHGFAERPDARQHGGVGPRQPGGVRRHARLAAEETERLDDALQVPGAVIKNSDHAVFPHTFTIYHSITYFSPAGNRIFSVRGPAGAFS